MKTTVGLSLGFGQSGNAAAAQRLGWSAGEDGFTWTVGTESLLIVAKPDAPFGFMIEIEFEPFVRLPHPASQRLRVFLNETLIEDIALTYGGVLAVPVQRPSAADGDMAIGFAFPDAALEYDDGRQIAFAFRRLRILVLDETFDRPSTPLFVRQEAIQYDKDPEAVVRSLFGIPVADLTRSFVNLAGDCEFGFLQRNCGVEPFDLLRFARAPPASVIHGLDDLFEGIGEDIEPYLPSADTQEWMIAERRYNFAYHTGAFTTEFDKAEIRKLEARKLQLLRLRFLQELAGGGGFFVFVDKYALSEAEVLPMFLALQRRSSGWMLWVQLARTADEVAEARVIVPGLVRGSVTRFSPPFDGRDIPVRVWLNLLINAWHLRLQVGKAAAPNTDRAW